MSKSNSKTLYLVRHAKSAWDSDALSDFDRPLSKRGESDSRLIANELSIRDWIPEKIITSPALRAKQTCLVLCEGLKVSVDESVKWDENFYAGYMITLLQRLTSLPESLQSVMLIGHNPSMEDLLLHLCNDVPRQSNGKIFTTGNVAKLSISAPWNSLMVENAKLKGLLRPKEH